MMHLESGHKWTAFAQDYVELCKPKVVLVMLVTMTVGALLAQLGWPNWALLSLANLGVGLCAASGAVMNHCIDQNRDQKMYRTHARPVAAGRVPLANASLFATLLGVSGFLLLWYWVNPLTAVMTLFAMIGYGVLYTKWLKPSTPQNIVIGGLAGAAPPLLGWLSVTPSFDPLPMMLVVIIFLWTPPHFWALAIAKQKEYAAAGLPMMPVTHGRSFTSFHALLYTVLMILATWLPFLSYYLGGVYFILANVGNYFFLKAAWLLWRKPSNYRAWYLFKVSILYVLWLFIVMLLDHYLRWQ
jgi:protoheme IX farnesyltransferase